MAFFRYSIEGATEDMEQENLTSQINGVTSEFTISKSFNSASLRVYYNGIRQTGDEVTISSSTEFQLSFTPTSGDKLVVDFKPS